MAANAPIRLGSPRGRKLAEFVPHHVLRHEQPGELPAVMNQERVTDEIRDDRAIARPGFERVAVAAFFLALDLGEQALIDVRPFFQGTTHGFFGSKTSLKAKSLFYLRLVSRPGDHIASDAPLEFRL